MNTADKTIEIKLGFPPNIEDIRARFGELPASAYFCYDNVIYIGNNSMPTPFPPDLLAHEGCHVKQQETVGGAKRWWKRYLTDDHFLLEVEIEAYKEQYRFMAKYIKDRNERFRYATRLATALASPQYGSLISQSEALRCIGGW